MNRDTAARAVDALLAWIGNKNAAMGASIAGERTELTSRLLHLTAVPERVRPVFLAKPEDAYTLLCATPGTGIPTFEVGIFRPVDIDRAPPVSYRDRACREGIINAWWFLALLLDVDTKAATERLQRVPDNRTIGVLGAAAWLYTFRVDLGEDLDPDEDESLLAMANAWREWLSGAAGDEEGRLPSLLLLRRYVFEDPKTLRELSRELDLAPLRLALRKMRAALLEAYACVYMEIEASARPRFLAQLPSPGALAARLHEPAEVEDRTAAGRVRQPGLFGPGEEGEGEEEEEEEITTPAPRVESPPAVATDYTIVSDVREEDEYAREARAAIGRQIAHKDRVVHQLRRYGFLHNRMEFITPAKRAEYNGGEPVYAVTPGGKLPGLRWTYADPEAKDHLRLTIVLDNNDTYIVQRERTLRDAESTFGVEGDPHISEGVYNDDIGEADTLFPGHWLISLAPLWGLALVKVDAYAQLEGPRSIPAMVARFLFEAELDRFLANPDHSGFDTSPWGGGTFVTVRKSPGPGHILSFGYVATSDRTVDTMIAVQLSPTGRITRVTYPVIGWKVPRAPLPADSAAIKMNMGAFRDQGFADSIREKVRELIGAPPAAPAPEAPPKREKTPKPASPPAAPASGEDPAATEGAGTDIGASANLLAVSRTLYAYLPTAVLTTWTPGVKPALSFTYTGETIEGRWTGTTWAWTGAGYMEERLPFTFFLSKLGGMSPMRAAVPTVDADLRAETRELLRTGMAIYATPADVERVLARIPGLRDVTIVRPMGGGTTSVSLRYAADSDVIPTRDAASASGEVERVSALYQIIREPGTWIVEADRTRAEINVQRVDNEGHREPRDTLSIVGNQNLSQTGQTAPPWLLMSRVFGNSPDADAPVLAGMPDQIAAWIAERWEETASKIVFIDGPDRVKGSRPAVGMWARERNLPMTTPRARDAVAAEIGPGWAAVSDGGYMHPRAPELHVKPVGSSYAVIHPHSGTELFRLTNPGVAGDAAIYLSAEAPAVWSDPTVTTGAALVPALARIGLDGRIQEALNDPDRDFVSAMRASGVRSLLPRPGSSAPAPTEDVVAHHIEFDRVTRRSTYAVNNAFRLALLRVPGMSFRGTHPSLSGELADLDPWQPSRHGAAPLAGEVYRFAGTAWVVDAFVGKLAPGMEAPPIPFELTHKDATRGGSGDEYASWLTADGRTVKVVLRSLGVDYNPTPYRVIVDSQIASLDGQHTWGSFFEMQNAVEARLAPPVVTAAPTVYARVAAAPARPPTPPRPAQALGGRVAPPRGVELPPEAANIGEATLFDVDALATVPAGSVFSANAELFIKRAHIDRNDEIAAVYHRVHGARPAPSATDVETLTGPFRLLVRGSPNDGVEVEEDFSPPWEEMQRRLALAQAADKVSVTIPALPAFTAKTDSVSEAAEALLLTAKRAVLVALATGEPRAELVAYRAATDAFGDAAMQLRLAKSEAEDVALRVAEVRSWWDAPSPQGGPPEGGEEASVEGPPAPVLSADTSAEIANKRNRHVREALSDRGWESAWGPAGDGTSRTLTVAGGTRSANNPEGLRRLRLTHTAEGHAVSYGDEVVFTTPEDPARTAAQIATEIDAEARVLATVSTDAWRRQTTGALPADASRPASPPAPAAAPGGVVGAGAPVGIDEAAEGLRVVLAGDGATTHGRHGVIADVHRYAMTGYGGGGSSVRERSASLSIRTDAGATVNASISTSRAAAVVFHETERVPVTPDPVRDGVPVLAVSLFASMVHEDTAARQHRGYEDRARLPEKKAGYRLRAIEYARHAKQAADVLRAWVDAHPAEAAAVEVFVGAVKLPLTDPRARAEVARVAGLAAAPSASPAPARGAFSSPVAQAVAGGEAADDCREASFTHDGQAVRVACGARGQRDVWHNIYVGNVRFGWNGARWAKGLAPSPAVLAAVRAQGVTAFPTG